MRGDYKDLIRDCLAKLDKIDINEKTWDDIIDEYELEYSSDHLRKLSYGFRMYRDAFNEDSNESEEFIKLKKERQKISDLRVEVNKQIRQLSRIEDLTDTIINECKNTEGYKLPDVSHVELHEGNGSSILMISDIHYDGRQETIDRFNKVIDYTINKCKFHKVNKLMVCLGGDLINNEMRTTTRIENREAVSKQISGVSKLVSDGLYKLSKNIPYVLVANVVGNHSRSIMDYKDALSTDNYLCLIKELIELRLNDVHNIVFIENEPNDDRFCIFNMHNKTYCLMHGDGLKGVQKNAIPTVEGFLDKRIDYLLLGHFHQIQDYMHFGKRVIINGAMCNEFDYSKKGLLNTPCYQRLLMLDEVGDIECIYDVKLH